MPAQAFHQPNHKDDKQFVWPVADALPAPMSFGQLKWSGEGGQSKWTPAVREFAASFDLSTMDGIGSLCRRVHSFRRVAKSFDELMGAYAKRTADEVLLSKKVFVKHAGFSEFPKSFPQVDGCIDYALAIATALRCGGVSALFVREGSHSKVLFKHHQETYVADNYSPDFLRQRQQPDTVVLAGLDPADIGMKSLADYWIASGERGERLKRQFTAELASWRKV